MTNRALRFSILSGKFAVCRLPPDAQVPDWAWASSFNSVTRTADEVSIVCNWETTPPEHRRQHPFMCIKLEGPFPLSEVGIMASFISPLVGSGVPVFVIATFDTDYVLIPEEFWGIAFGALQRAGHELAPGDDSWRKLIE